MNKLLYEIIYTNGTKETKAFETQSDASWYIWTEGDHIVETKRIYEDT